MTAFGPVQGHSPAVHWGAGAGGRRESADPPVRCHLELGLPNARKRSTNNRVQGAHFPIFQTLTKATKINLYFDEDLANN